MSGITSANARSHRARTFARWAAVLAAVFWSVGFLGVFDLLASLLPSSGFSVYPPAQVLEASWGLLYTVLIGVSLLMWAVEPGSRVFLVQVVSAGAAIVLVGVAGDAPGQAAAGSFVVLSALVPGAVSTVAGGLSSRPMATVRRSWVEMVSVVLLSLLTVPAIVASRWHAVMIAEQVRIGMVDEESWHLKHLPMQAAFGFAVAAALLVAVVAAWGRAPSWHSATLPAATSAVWFGLVCIAHPDQTGSVGAAAGWASVVWGIAVAAVAHAPRWRALPVRHLEQK